MCHLDPSSHLTIIDMGRKLGALPLVSERGAGSPSNTMSLGPRPTFLLSGILINLAIWPQQIWAENSEAVPSWGGGAGSPSNTVWPGPRPTCVPSFILIHPTVWPQEIWAENWGGAVWPQYTNVADKQDRQDRQTGQDNGQIAYGEPFYKRSPNKRPTLNNNISLKIAKEQQQKCVHKRLLNRLR